MPVAHVTNPALRLEISPGKLGGLPLGIRLKTITAVNCIRTGAGRVGDDDLARSVPVTEKESTGLVRAMLVYQHKQFFMDCAAEPRDCGAQWQGQCGCRTS